MAGSTRDSSRVVIRPLGPDDKDLLRRGFEQLSAASRYQRFLTPMPTLSRSALAYLTEVDHHHHEALLGIDPETGEAVGVARFVRAYRASAPSSWAPTRTCSISSMPSDRCGSPTASRAPWRWS